MRNLMTKAVQNKIAGKAETHGLQNSLIPVAEYKKLKAKGKKAEENLQLAVCAYIKVKYPDVIFMCDLASGMKMPIWIAAKNKRMRSSRALPDLFIAKPKAIHIYNRANPLESADIYYHGLFIELKKEGVRLQNGNMPSEPHIKEQTEILKKLITEGYMATFCCGLDEAIAAIDTYLK